MSIFILVVIIIISSILLIDVSLEYDIFANAGIVKIYLFRIAIINIKINITKQFLILSTSKKTYQLALRLNKEDIIFFENFSTLFLRHTYGVDMTLLINIGYRDSFDVVRIYSVCDIIAYYFFVRVCDNYDDISAYKYIFYSFTNNNCKIRLRFSFLINIMDAIYMFIYSYIKRVSYVKKYK